MQYSQFNEVKWSRDAAHGKAQPRARVLQHLLRARSLSLSLCFFVSLSSFMIYLYTYMFIDVRIILIRVCEAMADGYWNRQPPQIPSAGVLKRPRSDYGKCHALISEEFLRINLCIFNLMIYELRV